MQSQTSFNIVNIHFRCTLRAFSCSIVSMFCAAHTEVCTPCPQSFHISAFTECMTIHSLCFQRFSLICYPLPLLLISGHDYTDGNAFNGKGALAKVITNKNATTDAFVSFNIKSQMK